MGITDDRPAAIEVARLDKSLDRVEAVAGISLRVRQSELFGFLGPNGAGKSTTINLLTGLAHPDAGSVRLGGTDCTERPRAPRRIVRVESVERLLQPLQGRHRARITSATGTIA